MIYGLSWRDIMPRPRLTPIERLQRKKKVLEYDRERKRLKRMDAKVRMAEQTKNPEMCQLTLQDEEIHHNELLTFLLDQSFDKMSYADEGYRSMLGNFRTNDLQNLLAAFGHNKTGRKSELKERAINLLRNRPTGFNYQAYLSKILDIYRSMQNDVPSNNDMIRNMMQNQRQMMSMGMQQAQQHQQRMYQPPQYPQQPMHITRAGLPQVMPQMQRGMYGNNIAGNSNIQYGYQQSGPRNIVSQVPTNQQLSMGAPSDPMAFDMNATTSSGNSFIPSAQTLANIKLKKLPFYQIHSDIIKPISLVGQERCSLQNVPRGMREGMYKVTLLPEQATVISINRDVAGGKNEFIYQVQIRICLLEATSTEITDYLPLGLHIRVNGKVCPLPPTAPNTRPGTEARRTPRPINCTQLVKLNPNLINQITVNWTPDGKNYVMAIYLVKKLSSDTLLQKLQEKGARSSEDTKNDIIKKLADVDPDLATTSYRFSLVCPLGKMKMKIPAKSVNCDHLQCFDASIFILMNEKKPTWMCPTCNKSCLYDDIQIESYFLDIVSNPTLADCCKEIEILADGTWRVYVESKEPENTECAPIIKEKPIDSVTLDDSDDGNDNDSTDVRKDSKAAESSKEPETLKSTFVDLTLSDNDEEQPPKEKDKQENEALAADAVQPVTAVDFKPQAQVQPQQAVTSSEQGVVIEIDSPSPPASPTPTTEAS